jgi:hypothetical protein
MRGNQKQRTEHNKMKNYFKTSDIKIWKDSQNCFTATHKFQGHLIDGSFYASRQECRREAVLILKEKKEAETLAA